MNTQTDIIQRIRSLMDLKRKTSLRSFGLFVGIDTGNFSRMMSENAPITDKTIKKIADSCGVSFNWLAFGEEPMVKETEEISTSVSNAKYSSVPNVPLVNIDSVGGIHSLNDIDTPEYVEGLIPIAGARDGDLAIYQSGDSMSPTIPSGAILQIREVVGWREYIGYGDVFVLLLDDDRRITKAIYKYDEDPANYFLCVSYNEMVPDEPLPKSIIRRVWKVIRILITKGW